MPNVRMPFSTASAVTFFYALGLPDRDTGGDVDDAHGGTGLAVRTGGGDPGRLDAACPGALAYAGASLAT